MAAEEVDYDALFDAAFDAPAVKAVIEGKVVPPVKAVASVSGSVKPKLPEENDITPEREELSQQRRPSALAGSPTSSTDPVKEKRRLSLNGSTTATAVTAAAGAAAAGAAVTPEGGAAAVAKTPLSAADKAKAKAKAAAPKHKCGACAKEPGTIFAPMPASGGKQRMKALCGGCAKKAVFCTKCKGLSAKGVREDENERCKACGWVMCDPECKGACVTCEEGTLRPLKWGKCSRRPCGQQWAETTKWCATCGRCSLKKCSGKISVCKEPSCKQGQPPKPCQQAIGGKQRLPAKHYHCANCIKMAKDIMKCPVCENPCECSKCTTCSAGSCCNFGSAKECKHDDCKKQVCRSCEQKGKATGKPSGLCKEHHGSIKIVKVKKADPTNMGMLKRRSSSQGQQATPQPSINPGKKRRRCSGCEGSERVGRPHYILRGDLFCGVCIKKQKRTPPKKEATAKVDAATAEPAPAMSDTAEVAAATVAAPAVAAVAAAPAAAAAAGAAGDTLAVAAPAVETVAAAAAASASTTAAVAQEASSTAMATTEDDTEATQPQESQLGESQAETELQVFTQESLADTQPPPSSQESVDHMPRTNTLQLFDDTPTSTPTPSTPPAQTVEDAVAPMEQNE